MNAVHISAVLLALSKHKVGGIIGIVAGVLITAFGGLRVMRRTAGAMMLGFVGLVVLILGVLLYARTI